MRRVGIYFFYDKEGIVDGYVPYFINGLHKVVDYLIVVINGRLNVEGRKTLTACADDLFVRENVGFDAWAYKEAIEYIGWDELKKFDELVLTNNTIYGPIFPFEETFRRLDEIDCDFWGMSTNHEDKNLKSWFGVPLEWGYKPESITSNFCVYKSSVLHSYEFYMHWKTMPQINNYFESCVYHEMAITKALADAGFIYLTVDQADFRTVCPSPTVYGAFDMIARYKVPIIRKKAFYDPNGSLDYCTDVPRKIMSYLAEHTDYDCDLIWDNLLRTVNQYDLKNWFNWNTILPMDYSCRESSHTKVAVIFHSYYIDILEKYLHNIESFPDGSDFYFTTDTVEKREALMAQMAPYEGRFQIEFRLVENRGRDVSALLVACRDVVLEGNYDLICFMHDKKGIGDIATSKYSCIGDAFSDCCFENIAPTSNYVNNVIELFEKNPRLGIAVPPPPMYANYYKVIGGGWAAKETYLKAEQLLRELNLPVPMDDKKPPVAPYGSVFWFRPDALLPLFKKQWKYDDFDREPMQSDSTILSAIERLHSLIAQGMGYYPMVIMSSRYAEQEVTQMTEIAHAYVNFTLQYVGSKPSLKSATTQFAQILHKIVTTPSKTTPVSVTNVAVVPPKVRSPLKRFVWWVCPIGVWNILRKYKCRKMGWIYVDEDKMKPRGKKIIKACFPRGLWNGLRRLKCVVTGGVYREDGV